MAVKTSWVDKIGSKQVEIDKSLDKLRKKYPAAPPEPPPDKGKGKIDPFRRGALLEGVSRSDVPDTMAGERLLNPAWMFPEWTGKLTPEQQQIREAKYPELYKRTKPYSEMGAIERSQVNIQENMANSPNPVLRALSTPAGQTATNVVGAGLLALGAYQTLDAAYSGLTNYATKLAFQKMAASRGGKLTPQEVRVAQDWASQYTRNSILKADAKTLFKRTPKGYQPTDYAVKVADETASKAIAQWNPRLAPTFTPGGTAVPGQTKPLAEIMARAEMKLGKPATTLSKLATQKETQELKFMQALATKAGFDLEAVQGIAPNEYWVSLTRTPKEDARRFNWLKDINTRNKGLSREQQSVLGDIVEIIKGSSGGGKRFYPFKTLADAKNFLETGDTSGLTTEVNLRGEAWTPEKLAETRLALAKDKGNLQPSQMKPGYVPSTPFKPYREPRRMGDEFTRGTEAKLKAIDAKLTPEERRNFQITVRPLTEELPSNETVTPTETVGGVTPSSPTVPGKKPWQMTDNEFKQGGWTDYNKAVLLPSEYKAIYKNEGTKARNLVYELNSLGTTTLDTHATPKEIVIHIPQDVASNEAVKSFINKYGATVESHGLIGDYIKIPKAGKIIPKATSEPAPVPGKEPWQMTKGEYLNSLPRSIKGAAGYAGEHKVWVKNALGIGKPVPTEVLAEYPDLVKPQQVVTPEPIPAVTATSQAQKVVSGEIPPAEPPVSGGETAGGGQLPEDFAANIRLSKYPEEVRQFIKEWVDANPEAIANARRGVRSDAEVLADAQELAEDVGGDFARMQSRWKAGDAWNAEEILALRGTLRAKTEAVLAAQKVALQSNSTENLLKLKLALEEQAAVQEAVSGVTAEAGRALRQFRQEVFGASTDAEKLERLLKEVGGRDKIEDLAKLLGELDINNPVAVNAFIRALNKPGFWDYITEIYYNSILSGPKTHIVNSLSNTFNAIVSPVERGAAALIDIPLSRWQGREQTRFLGEVPADVFGAISGIMDGFKAGGETYYFGISPQQASKFEMQRTKAFTGIPGRIINFPSTSLEAADALMQSVNYRAAFNATAFRMVKKSGKKGSDFIEALAELKANPTKELLAEADKITETRLFRAPAGKTTQTIMNLRDALAIGGFKPLRYVIPFVRTPANLLKYGIERSPGGWLNPKLWENVAKKNPEAADQIGRAVLGSLAAIAIMWYVLEEKITGAAPTNSAERDRFYRDGKQPFSIKVGNNWISYQRLEPFNQTFAQVAAVYEATKNKERDAAGKATDAMSTIAQNMVSQTYLSGLSSVIDALSQPERYASSILTRFGTALVIPASSLTRTAAQIADKTVRDAQNLGDEFKVGIPGLSKQVPSKLTAFGEDVIRTTPAWSPINISPSKETPLTRELDRLQINIGFTGSTIAGIPLTADEQRAYQIQAGQLTEKMLTALMSNPAYPSASDTEKEKAINLMVDKARNQARTTILAGIPPAERVNRVKNKTITPLAPVQAAPSAPQALKDRLKPRAVPSGAR